MIYEIKVKGELDKSWSDWLGEVEITSEAGGEYAITILRLEAADQPTLFGVLDRIRDFNLRLISVNEAG